MEPADSSHLIPHFLVSGLEAALDHLHCAAPALSSGVRPGSVNMGICPVKITQKKGMLLLVSKK